MKKDFSISWNDKVCQEIFTFWVTQNLYTGLVDPHFRYCCAVWGVCGLTEIQQLQKLQNRAARIITGSNYDAPSKPLIKGLGWKTIEDLIQYDRNLLSLNLEMVLPPSTSSICLLLTQMIPGIIYEILPQTYGCQRRIPLMGRKAFPTKAWECGIAYQQIRS